MMHNLIIQQLLCNILHSKQMVYYTKVTLYILYIIYRLLCNGFNGPTHLRSNWATELK